MYVDVPTKVSAMELISSPDTPKSHILIWPFDVRSMFEGFMSGISGQHRVIIVKNEFASVNDPMNII
jgi:hypothetical protein